MGAPDGGPHRIWSRANSIPPGSSCAGRVACSAPDGSTWSVTRVLKRPARILEVESFFCVGGITQFRVKSGGSRRAVRRGKVRESFADAAVCGLQCPSYGGSTTAGLRGSPGHSIAEGRSAVCCLGRRPRINYLTIRYMVTPSPLGQTTRLTGLTYLVVEGTMTRPQASGRVAKKEPEHTNPLQTPAPTLAKTK